MLEAVSRESFTSNVEEIDRARAREYALLATLLSRGPDSVLLSRLADLRDDASPIGVAHGAVRDAALRVNEATAEREYFALFAGLREGSLFFSLFGGDAIRTPARAAARSVSRFRYRNSTPALGT